MGRIHKFLSLPLEDRALLIKSVFLVSIIRLGLWCLPFRILRQILKISPEPKTENFLYDPSIVSRLVWAIITMSRYVPRATCLTQALAAQVLLLQQGYPADLRIGVVKGKQGQLEAHAWLECNGHIVIGGSDSPLRFTAFPNLERKHQ